MFNHQQQRQLIVICASLVSSYARATDYVSESDFLQELKLIANTVPIINRFIVFMALFVYNGLSLFTTPFTTSMPKIKRGVISLTFITIG